MKSQRHESLHRTLNLLGYPDPHEITLIPHSTSTTNYRISFDNQAPILARYYKQGIRDAGFESRLLRKLYDHQISVPEPLHFQVDEEDPFCLLEFVGGDILGNHLMTNISEKTRQTLEMQYIKTLSAIHLLDWQVLFPDSRVPDFNKNPHAYADELFKRRQRDVATFDVKKECKTILKWLNKHKNQIETIQGQFLHGDYHPFNIISHNQGLTVIDWEGVDIGDNREDLAFALMTLGSLNNAIGRETTVEKRLLELYAGDGHNITNLDFFYVTAALHRVVKLYRVLTPEFSEYELYSQVFFYLKQKIEDITDLNIDLTLG